MKGGFGAPQKKSAQKNVPDKANHKRPVNRKLGVDDFRMAITRGNMGVITESVANGTNFSFCFCLACNISHKFCDIGFVFGCGSDNVNYLYKAL